MTSELAAELPRTAALFRRFESLGDNCEFGFVQRANGYEDGGLLRWAVTPFEGLMHCLENRFARLYLFENLMPSADDMVRDMQSGICFHSEMRSSGGKFLLDENSRRQIYGREKAKVDHLLSKLLERLHESTTIFIYKRNQGLGDPDAKALKAALARYSNADLLVVNATDDAGQRGRIERNPANYFQGYLTRFAPYERANDIMLEEWNNIVRNMA